jgi:hypothetical protein
MSQRDIWLGRAIILYISPAETKHETTSDDANQHASLLGSHLQPEYEKNENVIFHNQVPGTSITAPDITDETFMDGKMLDTDLSTFLQRPVKIGEISWTEGNSLNTTFDPWFLFFNTNYMGYKIRSFAFLRCKMKIHVQINASPFYYGRALVSYRPLPDWGQDTTGFSGDEKDTVLYSQRPSFWINSATSQGGDMELPFVFHRNWLKLGSASQFHKMGQLRISSPTPLKNANSVTGSDVKIVIWAMAVEPTLAGLSDQLLLQSQPVKIGPSSKVSRNNNRGGKSKSKLIQTNIAHGHSEDAMSILKSVNQGFKDEYGKGVVSSTATALADAAGVVSSIPVVGPFATATAAAASCVAGVADYFGWTNVPNINNTEPVKNQPFPAFASPSISTPVEKLSVDAKNELCIDSRTVGLDGSDELSIESLVTRESYLITANMDESQATNTILLAALVLPTLFRVEDETINGRLYKKQYNVPMSHVARMFRYWRGDISFRFVANKTRYHAGRVMFTWDPVKQSPSAINATSQYSAVWDFTETDEFVFTVPYNQQDPWLEINEVVAATVQPVTTGGTVFTGSNYANGQLVMSVLTNVTGPAVGTNIDIMVFVRGCPNMKFNDPIQVNKYHTAWRPQTSIQPLHDFEWIPQSSVESLETNQIQLSNEVSAISLVTMGEDHISLRPLLHRTNEYIKQTFDSDTTSLIKYANHILPRMPFIPGFDPSGIHVTNLTGSPRYNYVPHTAYTWLAPLFLGMRGSITYHVNASSPELIDTVSISRSHKTLATADFNRFDNVSVGVNDSVFNVHFLDNDVDSGMAGMALTNQKTQAGLSVNIPMYSRFRMVPTIPPGIGDADTETDTDSFRVFARLNPAGSGKNSNLSYLTTYYNMGPDFNFYCFINVPILYCADPPTAAP